MKPDAPPLLAKLPLPEALEIPFVSSFLAFPVPVTEPPPVPDPKTYPPDFDFQLSGSLKIATSCLALFPRALEDLC